MLNNIPALSEETSIPVNTLYTWRTKLRKDNPTGIKVQLNGLQLISFRLF